MNLKIKFFGWSAGSPVAMLNTKTAENLGVHSGDRVSVNSLKNKSKKFSIIVDISHEIVKENEIALSSEIKELIPLHHGEKVRVELSETPKSLFFIKNKLNNKSLSRLEISQIIKDIINNSLSESEIAMFISAMYRNGMNFKETIYLTEAILDSGYKLSFDHELVVDKHCIGGIPGNRTTPIVVSICAATGLIFPKTSSRAITSAAGTADVIETLARIEFSLEELKKIIKKENACMVWGGAFELVPADSKIISIEKKLKIDPHAQMLASIMSKKLAVGSKYILIDIPFGKGAKVNRKEALKLKREFEQFGRYFKRKIKCVLTDGKQPIGNGIGPVLEMKDVIAVLDPSQKSPSDLKEKSIFLAGSILELSGKVKQGKGISTARKILDSGEAFEKFKRIIKAQSGKVKELSLSKIKKDILSSKSGRVSEIDNMKINSIARSAGCPTDQYSGIYLHKHVNDKVQKGDAIMTIYAQSNSRLKEAVNSCNYLKPFKIL